MEKQFYSRLDQTIYTDQLSNGLRLYVIPKSGFAKKYAFFATNYGSIDTQFERNGKAIHVPDGIAHYLEHKMFDTEDGHALQDLSATGASPNAFTSYCITAYYFECTDSFEDNLKSLLSFVSIPYFTEETVAKEQGIIAQEIKMYEDNPGSRLGENLFRAMYQNHPLKVNIAGTVESIADITPELLYTCHNTFYDPSNMVLCIAADVDPEWVKKVAEECLPASSGIVPMRDYGDTEPAAPAKTEIRQSMEVAMPMFAIGFKCPFVAEGQERLRQELIGDLAAEIVCGESSPLYRQLYEDGLIDSGFAVGYEMLKGMPNLSMSGDSEDPKEVRRLILLEVRRIAAEGVDEALFERLKRASLGQRIRGLDSFDGLCYRMALGTFDRYDYFKFPQLYDQISPEDVRQFIETKLTEEQTVLSVIDPIRKEA